MAVQGAGAGPPSQYDMAENWIMVCSEMHRYQGVSYKSDIIVISGLDPGDRQVLEQKYNGCEPPCLLDTSDGRFVLKGPCYNPLDVMNCLMTRRGYKVQGNPQQRTLPNIHNKDDNYIPERANMHTTATRVTKDLVKALVKRESQTEFSTAQKFAMIYHLSKDVARNRADTQPTLPAMVNAAVAAKKMVSSPKKKESGSTGLTKQTSDLRIK